MGVKEFFKPDKWKLALSLFFFVIIYIGWAQSWGFCRECRPKPFLYDFIAPFSFFWVAMLILTIPLSLLTRLLSPIIWLGDSTLLLSIPYVYILSCVIVRYGKKLVRHRKKFNAKLLGFWAAVFVALRVFDSIIRPWLASQAGEQMFVSGPQMSLYDTIGGFAIDVIVFAFCAFLVSAVYFIIREKIKK